MWGFTSLSKNKTMKSSLIKAAQDQSDDDIWVLKGLYFGWEEYGFGTVIQTINLEHFLQLYLTKWQFLTAQPLETTGGNYLKGNIQSCVKSKIWQDSDISGFLY